MRATGPLVGEGVEYQLQCNRGGYWLEMCRPERADSEVEATEVIKRLRALAESFDKMYESDAKYRIVRIAMSVTDPDVLGSRTEAP